MRTYTFEIDDKEYSLRYNYNSICDLEEASGKTIQTLFDESSIGFSTIRILVWAGLKWKNNGITKQQVGFMMQKAIEEDKLQEIASNAMKVFIASVGKGGEETEGES